MALKVAVLASGRGTDFQSIVDGIEKGEVDAKIVVMITNNPDAGAIERARSHGIEHMVIDGTAYKGRDEEYFDLVDAELAKRKVELVVLAGWMKFIRSGKFLKKWKGKLINIHPSLLPKFPGAHAQKDAFKAGEKVSGYTIHFVDESLDGGPVIYQESVPISDCKSADEVAAKILEREHAGLPKIVDSFAKGKYGIKGKKVTYLLFGAKGRSER
ncbi:MAG: phosphoribosylglycinamide formyltransferase [Candidatus Burarchaeum sp.]|nr:phosphoribosylglycinamide formyltransferase [Candidatus Burarchaeum sp.]MDO8340332.1 phosphoribosylglycinamide formyltransferase [Candidatus Burarchaeum sp.]